VSKELNQLNWIKNIQSFGSEELLDEFVLLFTLLGEVQLTEEDTIKWKWTATGEYSAALAYDIQFLGAFPFFRASTIWQARVEPRCRFFTWLVLQGKAPTTDNLARKNCPCSPQCSLCYCINETNDHILAEYNFMEAV
jgi:hypothetical protein